MDEGFSAIFGWFILLGGIMPLRRIRVHLFKIHQREGYLSVSNIRRKMVIIDVNHHRILKKWIRDKFPLNGWSFQIQTLRTAQATPNTLSSKYYLLFLIIMCQLWANTLNGTWKWIATFDANKAYQAIILGSIIEDTKGKRDCNVTSSISKRFLPFRQ